jgi:hypothetical protein
VNHSSLPGFVVEPHQSKPRKLPSRYGWVNIHFVCLLLVKPPKNQTVVIGCGDMRRGISGMVTHFERQSVLCPYLVTAFQ